MTDQFFGTPPSLTANNSHSKAHTPNKFHIFGKLWTWAFTWSYPGYFFLWANFEEWAFYGKRPFFAFLRDQTEKIFKWPRDCTILKFGDLPIAHFEADVPLFSKHMLEIAIKFWVPAHFKVSWSRTMTAKICVFGVFLEKIIVLTHFDPMNPPKCYTWLESYGSAV